MEIVGLKRKKEKTDDGKVRDEEIEQKAMTGEKKGGQWSGERQMGMVRQTEKEECKYQSSKKKITREKKEGNQTRQ